MVVDDLLFIVKCKNVIVEMQEFGFVMVLKEVFDGGFYIECGSFFLSMDFEFIFICEDGDFYIVIFIVMDDFNQFIVQCEVQIVIEDLNNFCCVFVFVICQEVIVVLVFNGQGILLFEEIGGNSIMECGFVLEFISQSFFDCDDIGSIINVIYIIIDFNGVLD